MLDSGRLTGQPEVIPLFCRHSDCRPAFGLDTSHQIVPTIPHRMLEITVVWNPVRSALSPHFDPALIDPVEDADLVCDAGVVGGVQATELEVSDEAREIVLMLRSLIHRSSHAAASRLSAPDASHRPPAIADTEFPAFNIGELYVCVPVHLGPEPLLLDGVLVAKCTMFDVTVLLPPLDDFRSCLAARDIGARARAGLAFERIICSNNRWLILPAWLAFMSSFIVFSSRSGRRHCCCLPNTHTRIKILWRFPY